MPIKTIHIDDRPNTGRLFQSHLGIAFGALSNIVNYNKCKTVKSGHTLLVPSIMHNYNSENTPHTVQPFPSGKIQHSDSPPHCVPFSTTILREPKCLPSVPLPGQSAPTAWLGTLM